MPSVTWSPGLASRGLKADVKCVGDGPPKLRGVTDLLKASPGSAEAAEISSALPWTRRASNGWEKGRQPLGPQYFRSIVPLTRTVSGRAAVTTNGRSQVTTRSNFSTDLPLAWSV